MRAVKLAVSTVALVAAFLVPMPAANAAGGNITHYSPDSGYNAAFSITCYGGGTRTVYEGQNSNCSNGTTSIYVWPGQEIWCQHTYPYVTWYLWVDATGSHNISGTVRVCVSQAD